MSLKKDLISAESAQMGTIEPQERLRQLAANGNNIEIDGNIPIIRYYRSGLEIVRMAYVYLQEGNEDCAYILCIKFMTLFLEKILKHPEYKRVPADLKQQNQKKLKEVLPVAEKLKLKLLEKYSREYQQFLEQKRRERELEEKRQNELREKAKLAPVAPAPRLPEPSAPSMVDSDMLNRVLYPNDFPTDLNRSSGAGLLLPDNKSIPKPLFDRTLKPSPTSVAAGSLRPVIVPTTAMAKFLQLASRNTLNNVETCGILAGRLAKNQLLITHVVVPKQKGTSDSCTTMNEEDIFNYQDQHNLITLGWIHTHPSQTAFLSSVDLHTHCSYQMMLEEAIAIVCSPKYEETGFFCLTPSYGLDYISQCRQSGFHPHPKDPALFMEALHITLDDKAIVEVVDLR
ncbi:STAM-binding protein [Toxorhynchites rutilus septentrionalis]|uniref:STAM-binding protein n=1 Tax=Toxorhynchites rutilus septentrionalis TaxID=329112 RepID=UPI00247AD24B|nr:STAM-binding protein [Toxorhynchites rutilus septentrionalis]